MAGKLLTAAVSLLGATAAQAQSPSQEAKGTEQLVGYLRDCTARSFPNQMALMTDRDMAAEKALLACDAELQFLRAYLDTQIDSHKQVSMIVAQTRLLAKNKLVTGR